MDHHPDFIAFFVIVFAMTWGISKIGEYVLPSLIHFFK